MLAHEFYLFVGVEAVLVERHDDGLSERLHVAYVAVHVPEALLECLVVRLLDGLVRSSAVHLECLCGDDEYGEGGVETCRAALDVEELLRTQVGTEASLRDGVVAVGQRSVGGDDGVAAVRYVGERSAVYEGCRSLGGLHEVRGDGVGKESDDGAGHLHVAHVEWLLVQSISEEDVVDALAHVLQGCGEAEDGHEFRCRRDVESALGRDAGGGAAQSGDDMAELSVVDVEDALPESLAESEALGGMLVDVVVQQGGYHVVCGGDGVEVAGEVEVDLLHRQHLCVAAACCTALHAEAWSEGRLAEGQHGLLAYLVHAQGQSDADGGLAVAGLCGADGGDEDELVLLCLLRVDGREWHLGDVTAVRLYGFRVDAHLFSNVCYGLKLHASCNFNV